MSDKPTHVIIDRESLEILAAAAAAGLLELADGISDGTYEDDAIAGTPSEKIKDAVETAQAVLA
jgi:hypothetical protein